MKVADRQPQGYVIDVKTHHVKKLVSKLKRLKSTADVEPVGVYDEDKSYSKVFLLSTMSEEEIDRWLCKTKLDWVGVTTSQEDSFRDTSWSPDDKD